MCLLVAFDMFVLLWLFLVLFVVVGYAWLLFAGLVVACGWFMSVCFGVCCSDWL